MDARLRNSSTEGKGNNGCFGICVRREIVASNRLRAVFRYSRLLDWFSFVWSSNESSVAPTKVHWHHCYMQGAGQDGGMICRQGNADHVLNRCFLPGAVPYGTTGATEGSGILRHMSFCVDLRLHAMQCSAPTYEKWANLTWRQNIPCFVHNFNTTHAGASANTDRKYHNTHVGTQNTYYNANTGSLEGMGSNIGPEGRGANHRVFNSIGAVYPPAVAWPRGYSNVCAVYFTTGGSTYDYNILFRSAGMHSPGQGSNTFVVTSPGQGSNSGRVSYADIAALRSGAGYEVNGVQADPQFVATPAYASANPYAAGGAFDIANYLLGPSSPARTGARNLNDQNFPDYDFETLTTWIGGANAPWRGALQPDVPAIEQEIGIVGPQPPTLV